MTFPHAPFSEVAGNKPHCVAEVCEPCSASGLEHGIHKAEAAAAGEVGCGAGGALSQPPIAPAFQSSILKFAYYLLPVFFYIFFKKNNRQMARNYYQII